MTPRQKAELRAGEIQSRLAAIAETTDWTDEIRSELSGLRTEYRDLMDRIGALAIAEDKPTTTKTETTDAGEARELRALRGRVEFGHYIEAAIEKRHVDGAAKEWNEALGVGLNRFPLEILGSPAAMEDRATTDVDTTVNTGTWLDRQFADTAAARFGTFESVAPGVKTYPITLTGAESSQRARGEAATDGAWTVDTVELKPTRNTIRRRYTNEDALRNPGVADAIRREIRQNQAEKIDRTIFLGDATATGAEADIAGLNTLSIGETQITQANKAKGPELLKAFLALIDGKYAGALSELRVVPAVGAMQLWGGTVANAQAENATISQFLAASGLNLGMARGEIETATAAGDIACFVGLGRGIEGAAPIPVWQEATLIVDPYTSAASGEVVLTAHVFWNFALVRAANFHRFVFAA